jgi:Fe-S-cluster containining protein
MRPPMPSPLTTLARKTDDWFRRANAALLSQVPCQAGCSHCCTGVFPITRLDARLLHEGLSQLPDIDRQRIVDRAIQQTAAMQASEPRLAGSPSLDQWPDGDIDRVVTAFSDVRCPALSDEGLCSLYAYRPLTCRSMGIPMREGLMVNGACNVQTFVPIVRLPESLETEEQAMARRESAELAMLPEVAREGEELLLPYGFVSCGLLDE